MKFVYRDILKHSGIYGVGQILSRLASFLMLPVYTRFLTTADYGVIALLDLMASVLGVLIGGGMASAVVRHHFEVADESERRGVWWTGLTFVLLMATALVLPGLAYRDLVARLLLGDGEPSGPFWCFLVLVTMWFTAVAQLPITHLRAQKQSGLFVATALGRLIVNLALNVLFLVGMDLGVVAILLGNLITSILHTAVLTAIFARSRGRYAFSWPLLGKLFHFGWPLVFTALISVMMRQVDRYMIRTFVDLGSVGIYSLAARIATALSTFYLMPFTAIWNVLAYEIAEQPDAEQIYARVFEYFMYGIILLVFGLSLFAEPFLAIMAAPEFGGAADVIPILSLAQILFSALPHFNLPLRLTKKNERSLPAFGAGLAVLLGLGVVLIPRFGIFGAAWSMVLATLAVAAISYVVGQSVQRIRYPVLRCATVAGLCSALFLGQRFVVAELAPWWITYLVAAALWITMAVLLLRPVLRKLVPWLRRRLSSERSEPPLSPVTPPGEELKVER